MKYHGSSKIREEQVKYVKELKSVRFVSGWKGKRRKRNQFPYFWVCRLSDWERYGPPSKISKYRMFWERSDELGFWNTGHVKTTGNFNKLHLHSPEAHGKVCHAREILTSVVLALCRNLQWKCSSVISVYITSSYLHDGINQFSHP